jgi:hypothetical protein
MLIPYKKFLQMFHGRFLQKESVKHLVAEGIGGYNDTGKR